MKNMAASSAFIVPLALFVILASPLCGMSSAKTIHATIGDTIPLNGSVQLGEFVYLFVTGPGIPVNGARMENSNAAVVTGSPDTFTQVLVENGKWAYQWNTGRVSGGLASGSHTVYASTQPVAANALSGVDYAEIEIVLQAAVTTAALRVETDPEDAGIYLNGKYSGDSPKAFPGLAPGEYVILLEKQGYAPEQGSVTLAAGDDIQFVRSLSPLTSPTIAVTDTPLPPIPSRETLSPTPTAAPLCAGYLVGALLFTGLLYKNRS